MDQLKIRGGIIILFFALVFLSFGARLFSIQVVSTEYASRADRYVIKTKSIVPPRGNIYNRHGEIYVSNQPMFKMMVTPRNLHIPDTALLLKHLNMSKEELERAIAKAARHSSYKESVIAQHLDLETCGILQESLWDARGISFSVSNKRHYEYPVGANILGYISEVDSSDIKASGGKYRIGDLVGKTGIERSHDTTLRGIQGQRKIKVDVHNREVGSYANQRYDTAAVKGKDMMLGIDTELQAFGEALMQGKRGSIVAIEPSTGEILAFISAPAYDPSSLTGSELYENWRHLQRDSLKPLFNRPLMAAYPPGSVYKLANALAALNEGVINENTYYSCGGGFSRNKGKPGCRFHISPLALGNAIKHSCNSYFAATYMDFLHHPQYDSIYQAFDIWRAYMDRMGLGRKLGVDIPYEKPGKLPTGTMYDRWYGHNRWIATTIISNSIGQGEILMTPLQMANLATLIANRGTYVKPHFLKAIRGDENFWNRISYDTVDTEIAPYHYRTVIDAMVQVVAAGTARRAIIEGIDVAGKTGTVENPHGEDHSVFLGFAPADRPRIAIAAIIENAGGGGRWAAPLSACMMEKYLKGEIVSKKFEYNRLLNARF
ncbi:MAG: penicillin-binding protein 2 [Bacteroidia bacterium]